MNKDLKRAQSMLEEKLKMQTTGVEESKKEVEARRTKLNGLRAELKNANTPEEYKAIKNEITGVEDELAFYEAQLKSRDTLLADAEYKEIERVLTKAFTDVTADAKKNLAAEMERFLTQLRTYDMEVEAINRVMSDAAIYHHNVADKRFLPQKVSEGNKELKYMVDTFYGQIKRSEEFLKKGLQLP